MPSIPAYISRITHQTSVAILAGGSLLAVASDELADALSTGFAPKLFMISAILSAASGLFNAHLAKPGNLGDAAKKYRTLVYGVKGVLWLALSPALKFVVPDKATEHKARAVAVIALVLVASYTKFLREEHQPPPKGTKGQS